MPKKQSNICLLLCLLYVFLCPINLFAQEEGATLIIDQDVSLEENSSEQQEISPIIESDTFEESNASLLNQDDSCEICNCLDLNLDGDGVIESSNDLFEELNLVTNEENVLTTRDFEQDNLYRKQILTLLDRDIKSIKAGKKGRYVKSYVKNNDGTVSLALFDKASSKSTPNRKDKHKNQKVNSVYKKGSTKLRIGGCNENLGKICEVTYVPKNGGIGSVSQISNCNSCSSCKESGLNYEVSELQRSVDLNKNRIISVSRCALNENSQCSNGDNIQSGILKTANLTGNICTNTCQLLCGTESENKACNKCQQCTGIPSPYHCVTQKLDPKIKCSGFERECTESNKTVCDLNNCTCVEECKSDSDCGTNADRKFCKNGNCVQCKSDNNCENGEKCCMNGVNDYCKIADLDHKCVDVTCVSDLHCAGKKDLNGRSLEKCISDFPGQNKPACVECIEEVHCNGNQVRKKCCNQQGVHKETGARLCEDQVLYKCVECIVKNDCPSERNICNDDYECVQCVEDEDCISFSGKPYCEQNIASCVQCFEDKHCEGKGDRCCKTPDLDCAKSGKLFQCI